jgi:hypothetical protein
LKIPHSHQYRNGVGGEQACAWLRSRRNRRSAMTEALVATFKDVRAITNVEDDLISTGIPSEKIKIDRDHRKIRVLVPDATRAEVLEILNRHNPAEVH